MIIVFLVIIGFRLPFYIEGIELLKPELKWMLIGERLNNGFKLYAEVIDDIGPFAAWMYQLIDLIFGRSATAYRFLATCLVFVQCYIFNSFLLANKSYRENTYVPAFMYGVFICYSIDFFTLSPQLVSVTFILLALNNIFKRIDNKTRDELFLYTGIHLAIAMLFYFPVWILFVTFLVILLVFSNSLIRRLLLMVIGFLTMLGIVGILFYVREDFDHFIIQYVNSHWTTDRVFLTSWNHIISLSIGPCVFTILAFLKIYGSSKFVNFQLKFQQAMLFLMLGVLFVMINANEVSSILLLFLIPSLAFFAAHFLLLIRRKLWIHLATFFILAGIFLTAYTSFRELEWVNKYVNYSSLYVKKNTPAILKGRKLLVLGDDISLYKEATPAMPFLNWNISRQHFLEVDYYDNAVYILQSFKQDPPEVIVDQSGLLPGVFNRIPTFGMNYQPVPNYQGYYIYSSK